MARVEISIDSNSVAETESLAAKLAACCAPGDCLMLKGELGAGKTAFARGFIQARCDVSEEIVSPTFTLVQTYPAQDGGAVWHFDLYRLKSAAEVQEIGLEDALAEGISLIEWPELVENQLPRNALTVLLQHYKGDARRIVIAGEAGRWQECLGAFRKAA